MYAKSISREREVEEWAGSASNRLRQQIIGLGLMGIIFGSCWAADLGKLAQSFLKEMGWFVK